jgi:N-methylhydantoinase A
VFLTGGELTAEAVAGTVSELGERARAALERPEAELRATYELRYRGQAFELPISAGMCATPRELRQAFEAEHEDRYGYKDPDQDLELVTIRVTATEPSAEIELAAADGAEHEEPGTRTISLAGEQIEAAVWRGALPAQTRIEGPAVVELPESTLLVPPDWAGEVDPTGTISLKR